MSSIHSSIHSRGREAAWRRAAAPKALAPAMRRLATLLAGATRWSRILPAGLLAWTCVAAMPVHAEETFETCTAFIDSVPVTITTQGTWCLRRDLATAITSGNAITIATNNVTVDCNGFKIGGLAAGSASRANGIYASERQNATVRHCGIRGFHTGIYITRGAGHLVEHNRLDGNLAIGIHQPFTLNSVIRDNRVLDTGGATTNTNGATAILAEAHILDNIVSGVFATGPDVYASGILGYGNGNQISGNHVSDLLARGRGEAVGIRSYNSFGVMVDNRIIASGVADLPGYGLIGARAFCGGNTIVGFATALGGCAANLGGNASQ